MIIGILVLLLAVVIVLLLNRNSEAESSGEAYDPSIQANLTNWGYACLIGEDLYTALPDTGLVKIKETDILTLETEPDAEVIKALPMADGETEFTDIMDLVAVGDLLYYQASGSDPDSNEFIADIKKSILYLDNLVLNNFDNKKFKSNLFKIISV